MAVAIGAALIAAAMAGLNLVVSWKVAQENREATAQESARNRKANAALAEETRAATAELAAKQGEQLKELERAKYLRDRLADDVAAVRKWHVLNRTLEAGKRPAGFTEMLGQLLTIEGFGSLKLRRVANELRLASTLATVGLDDLPLGVDAWEPIRQKFIDGVGPDMGLARSRERFDEAASREFGLV
jgi:hypothetical protein